jgi:hypothetical protein
VQQYKFIRLQKRANYEPLIMCLKGLQLAYNPGDYLTAEQLLSSTELQRDYEQLKSWSSEPTAIDAETIKEFLQTVREGLTKEMHNRPAHKLYYINWAMSALEVQLNMFNQTIEKQNG